MNDHAADVWKNRALEAEQKLFRAYEDLAQSRGNELLLHAELAEEQYESARRWDRFVEAEAAIARVRELCDEADGEPKRLFWPSEILRALDGGTE